MTMKQYRALQRLLIVLILLSMIGFAVGKYYAEVSVNHQITFNASLVTYGTDFYMQESKPTRDPNYGNYTIDTNNKTSDSTSYILMPGVDVPKDPHIAIQHKTRVPAYLYLVVTHSIPNDSGISFEIENCWMPVPGETDVYVYATTTAPQTPIVIDHSMDVNILKNIPILKDNIIEVSQSLKLSSSVTLTLSAVMKETYKTAEDQWETPANIYKN